MQDTPLGAAVPVPGCLRRRVPPILRPLRPYQGQHVVSRPGRQGRDAGRTGRETGQKGRETGRMGQEAGHKGREMGHKGRGTTRSM